MTATHAIPKVNMPEPVPYAANVTKRPTTIGRENVPIVTALPIGIRINSIISMSPNANHAMKQTLRLTTTPANALSAIRMPPFGPMPTTIIRA